MTRESVINWSTTHCARMDHGGCRLQVAVRSGKIVEVRGDPAGSLNRGYLCAKGRASAEKLNHPARLRRPLKRTGPRGSGSFAEISWQEAMAAVCQGLDAARKKTGPRSVAFCQGMPKGLEHFVLIRLANLFGSPNVVAVQDVCHAPREISGLHTCGFYPVADLSRPTGRVLLWGSRVDATNEEGQICRLLFDRMAEGTELIVVDPKRTNLAGRAAAWLPVRPGTDGLLALSFLQVIIEENRFDADFVKRWTVGFAELADHVRRFSPEKTAERTGVSPEAVRTAARLYAEARPAALQWGNAVEQNPNALDACRALSCLMAICGNLDVAGANIAAVDPKVMKLGRFVRADRIPEKPKEMIHSRFGTIPKMMTVPPAYFRRAVLEDDPYPVRAAYMQCTNPLLTWADSKKTEAALHRLDFIAVSEVAMTPTALFADIVLPAATQFEFDDIGHYGLGHGLVTARPKLVEPPKDCRPDIRILNDLGRRLTDEADWPEHWQDLTASVLEPSGLTWGQFVQRGLLDGPKQEKKYLTGGFRTPSGKVELAWSRAEALGFSRLPEFLAHPDEGSDRYPLLLTSAKDPHFLHSSYRWLESLRRHSPEPLACIHPKTAAAADIKDGRPVRIETGTGSFIQTARLTDAVRADVVLAAYGWWFPEEGAKSQYGWRRANMNMATAAEPVGKAFGTPCLKGIPCRVGPG
ncbi:MAG: molybdopterin-dependent oxidoreductase [Desulfobacterales bacterium]|nr:molybdopterin-dependent oxidoreductase [Desulfobacterales bacterium]